MHFVGAPGGPEEKRNLQPQLQADPELSPSEQTLNSTLGTEMSFDSEDKKSSTALAQFYLSASSSTLLDKVEPSQLLNANYLVPLTTNELVSQHSSQATGNTVVDLNEVITQRNR
ncbi:hypothetical protein Ciccas_005725 [Cichlidogyrus casuarinus]|uniref:Uncharacterized protein n=1 Tax=Cichlidogyrus casuarinus TaxID=1844966 RepID=A0ABD2Q7T9_9PLAT